MKWEPKLAGNERKAIKNLCAVKPVFQQGFHLVMQVSDLQARKAATGIKKEPSLIDRVAKGFDMAKYRRPRGFTPQDFSQCGATVKGEIDLSDVHGAGSLSVFWVWMVAFSRASGW